jgi:integrase
MPTRAIGVPNRCHNSQTHLIRTAKPPAAGTISLWDGSLKGFGVRISKGGTKTFIVLIGSGRRQAIGRYPFISLSEARSEAKRILAEKTLGKVRPKHVAFDDAKAEFLNECEGRLRPITLRLYRRHLAVHFPFARRSTAEISPREVIKRLNQLNDRPSEKQHAYRIAQTFFRWCVRQHIIDRSPMENMVSPPMGRARDRVLSEDELTAVYRTVLAGNSIFHRFVAMLILLGLRRGEAANLRWEFFDERTRTLTIPGDLTKNHRTLVIPYGPTVFAILKQIPRFSDRYLFPAAREQIKGKPATVISGFGKPKQKLDRESGVHGWVLHNCRRVFATGLQKLGVRLEVIEALLNHVSGTRAGIVGIYQRYDYFPEMQAAILRWDTHLQHLIAPQPLPGDSSAFVGVAYDSDTQGAREQIPTTLPSIARELSIGSPA